MSQQSAARTARRASRKAGESYTKWAQPTLLTAAGKAAPKSPDVSASTATEESATTQQENAK